MVQIRDRVFQLLEKAQPGDKASLFIDRMLAFLIVANVVAVTLETVDEIYQAYQFFFTLFEIGSVCIFTIEYILRIWVSASNNTSRHETSLKRRISYILSPSGLIDLLAILPAFLPCCCWGSLFFLQLHQKAPINQILHLLVVILCSRPL